MTMNLRPLALMLPLMLSAPAIAAELELRRSGSSYANGDPIWTLQLRDGAVRKGGRRERKQSVHVIVPWLVIRQR